VYHRSPCCGVAGEFLPAKALTCDVRSNRRRLPWYACATQPCGSGVCQGIIRKTAPAFSEGRCSLRASSPRSCSRIAARQQGDRIVRRGVHSESSRTKRHARVRTLRMMSSEVKTKCLNYLRLAGDFEPGDLRVKNHPSSVVGSRVMPRNRIPSMLFGKCDLEQGLTRIALRQPGGAS